MCGLDSPIGGGGGGGNVRFSPSPAATAAWSGWFPVHFRSEGHRTRPCPYTFACLYHRTRMLTTPSVISKRTYPTSTAHALDSARDPGPLQVELMAPEDPITWMDWNIAMDPCPLTVKY